MKWGTIGGGGRVLLPGRRFNWRCETGWCYFPDVPLLEGNPLSIPVSSYSTLSTQHVGFSFLIYISDVFETLFHEAHFDGDCMRLLTISPNVWFPQVSYPKFCSLNHLWISTLAEHAIKLHFQPRWFVRVVHLAMGDDEPEAKRRKVQRGGTRRGMATNEPQLDRTIFFAALKRLNPKPRSDFSLAHTPISKYRRK